MSKQPPVHSLGNSAAVMRNPHVSSCLTPLIYHPLFCFSQTIPTEMMAKVPEEALQQLQRTLGSSASPLQTRAFEAQYQAAVRASRTKQRSPSGTTTTNGSSRRSRGASERGGPGKAWNFRGLFSWGAWQQGGSRGAVGLPVGMPVSVLCAVGCLCRSQARIATVAVAAQDESSHPATCTCASLHITPLADAPLPCALP